MFKDYVNNVLFQHGGNVIEKCSLSCYSEYASTYLYTWICAIVCCGVQELTLETSGREFNHKGFPWSLFTCKTLVVLKIKGKVVLNLPSCFCLPNLKILHLDSVIYVDDGSAERLFMGCPCLEELDIKRNGWDGVKILSISSPLLNSLSIIFSGFYRDRDIEHGTKINTPNLEYLTLGDNISKDYFINPSPFLIEARVDHKCVYGVLQGIKNVRLLTLSGDIMMSLHNVLLGHGLPRFEHLSQLDLEVDSNVDWSLLPKLLDSAPNLKVLVFPEGLVVPYKNGRDFRRFYWKSPKKVPECLLFQLKTVEIQNFVGMPGEVYLVKFLLESSKVLEKMTIHCYNLGRKWKKIENREIAIRNIIRCHRVSEACEVEFFE
ncbi:hypothetical protein ACFE04_007427 [Oxalis oulophora]